MFGIVLLKMKGQGRERRKGNKKPNIETSQTPESDRKYTATWKAMQPLRVSMGFVLSGPKFKNAYIQFYTYRVCF